MAIRAGRVTGKSIRSLVRYMLVACHIILLDTCTLVRYSVFQVGSMGNCLYVSVKKGLGVRVANNRSHPYYPTQYMRWQVADWLVSNRQRVMMHKGPYLRETYGLADPTATFPQPFSYKQYCRQVLDKRFWGDAVISTLRLQRPAGPEPSPAPPSPPSAPTEEGIIKVQKKDLKRAQGIIGDILAGRKVRAVSGASCEDVPFQLPTVQAGDRDCSLCHQSFASTKALKHHQKTHTGDTGWSCEVCGKVLSTKLMLKLHTASCGKSTK